MEKGQTVQGQIGEVLSAFNRHSLLVVTLGIIFCFSAGIITIYSLLNIPSLSEANPLVAAVAITSGPFSILMFNVLVSVGILSFWSTAKKMCKKYPTKLLPSTFLFCITTMFAGGFFLDFFFDAVLLIHSL